MTFAARPNRLYLIPSETSGGGSRRFRLARSKGQPIASAPHAEIVPTDSDYLWTVGDQAHELLLAFGRVHVRHLPA
jgi:hypothetical protein